MRKRIVVTGGTKGIGRAILEKFASEDYDIAVCARNKSELNVLKTDLEKKHSGIDVFAEACDVRDMKAVIKWCDELTRKWDKFDILVNNAGTFLPGSVLTEPEENLSLQIETNLYSAYHFTRRLIPLIRENSKGHIFNICSIASKTAYAGGGAYTISKFAVYGFSQCLREELKPTNIKVTSILPGATWSDSWRSSSFTSEDMIQSEDIAQLVWQCSQLSKLAVVEEIIIRPQGGDL
ncbi:MAG: SDR family oxidoreductase [Saprospiraceae bacterium]